MGRADDNPRRPDCLLHKANDKARPKASHFVRPRLKLCDIVWTTIRPLESARSFSSSGRSCSVQQRQQRHASSDAAYPHPRSWASRPL
ncbi:hypothetical protein DOTSEDRAFT_72144 [Dothistroma septosporum NZE10]|uniref:Uncharacterized protein n=1 Tax=Dothistroma septosporum (strain NZE10 / CBS 128990) TaxID=675120 RepID=N1PQ89_DOTSN|nr:hypothetical protein DOTSEDRAFT_72144 [Dothistroma septosporum NZE10]